LSDLAGAPALHADVGAPFASGLAETHQAAVTRAILRAWAERERSRDAAR